MDFRVLSYRGPNTVSSRRIPELRVMGADECARNCNHRGFKTFQHVSTEPILGHET